MPKKYIDQISDDTNYITPNFDVVPILPDETEVAPASNIIIAPRSANAPN